MKRDRIMKNGSRGFTLLEAIITLIVASILGTILVSYMGTAMTGSAQLPYRQVKVYEMNQVMDNITADYISLLSQQNDVLTVLKGKIDGKTGNYGSYTSTTSWISYNSTPAEVAATSTEGILKVIIEPSTSGTGVKHTALFTR